MTFLAINEMFATIQGEAHYTGMPALFIRLQGCDVGCPWCDTKHTWHKGDPDAGARIGTNEMLAKIADAATYAMMSVDDIERVIRKNFPTTKHVVITGGEPCDHDLFGLTSMLNRMDGMKVQIETSGTAQVICNYYTWVTVSPKIDMPGGKVVLDQALSRAHEIKFPVGKVADIQTAKELYDRAEALCKENGRYGLEMWLQPLSQSEKATAICIAACSQFAGWRLSAQLHRFLKIR